MADLKENAITLLAKNLLVDMTATYTMLFTVPAGKSCIVTHVVVHTATALLGTDNDFGGCDAGADAVNDPVWETNLNLSTLIVGKYWVIEVNNALGILLTALKEFGILPGTGAGGGVTATIDVFGYLF